MAASIPPQRKRDRGYRPPSADGRVAEDGTARTDEAAASDRTAE